MMSQLVMAVPMLGLYILSIAIAFIFQKRRSPDDRLRAVREPAVYAYLTRSRCCKLHTDELPISISSVPGDSPDGRAGDGPDTRAAPPPPPPAPAAAPTDVRPATTTFMGDTGLWYVPTAEILPARKWSVSGYRVNFDDNQGFTDVSNWPVTFGFGVRDRVELFGSFVVVNRIDRDVRPLFLAAASAAQLGANRQAGGFVPQNPLARSAWSGNQVGDLWAGAKFNLWSEWRQQPAALAIRAMVKAPTGDTDSGASTGQGGFRAGCHRQQGHQRARRVVRLRRVHRPRRARRSRGDQRFPLGRRARGFRRASRCGSRLKSTASCTRRTRSPRRRCCSARTGPSRPPASSTR